MQNFTLITLVVSEKTAMLEDFAPLRNHQVSQPVPTLIITHTHIFHASRKQNKNRNESIFFSSFFFFFKLQSVLKTSAENLHRKSPSEYDASEGAFCSKKATKGHVLPSGRQKFHAGCFRTRRKVILGTTYATDFFLAEEA